MNRFVFEKYFHKSINISLCDKYFYKNKKSKLNFGDRVAVQNDIFLSMEGVVYNLGNRAMTLPTSVALVYMRSLFFLSLSE